MATFTKRNNKWRAQVRKGGIHKSAEFETKTEAQHWAKELEKQIEERQYNPAANITFAQWIDQYIREYTLKKRGAREEMLRLLRLAETPLGAIRLDELKSKHFRQWQQQRLTEISPNSVIRERISLSAVLSQAVKLEILEKNPLKNVDKPKEAPARTRRYSSTEIQAIQQASGFSFEQPCRTKYHLTGAAFLFALETAMRAGEICQLTWENVNLLTRTAFLPMTKNGHARTVPLSNQAIKLIQHLQQSKSDTDDRIFQLQVGTLGSSFQKIKQKAGLKQADLHFHDTRREALTRLSRKVDVMTLAKISGHRDLKILLNTYYAPNMSDIARLLD